MAIPLLRTSERRTFKRCSQAWWWSWRMGLKKKGRPADPLWFGTGIHLALAEWYCGPGRKRGPHPVETWRRYCAESGDAGYVRSVSRQADTSASVYFTEEKMVEAAKLGEVMMEGYVEKYGKDASWAVIQPEYSTQINIPHPTKPGEIIVIYCLTYDGVYRDLSTPHGDLFLMEHKTAASIPSGDHLELDDQAGSYWAVAAQTLEANGLIPKGLRLKGINYNYLRKALPDERPKDAKGYATNSPTKADYLAKLPDLPAKTTLATLAEIAEKRGVKVLGPISKVQPRPLFERKIVFRSARERATQIQRIADEALIMEAMRKKELPIIKNPQTDCGRCEYFDLCVLHESRAPGWKEYMRDAYRVEDPYADHRDATDE
jgi:hypothetical protein